MAKVVVENVYKTYDNSVHAVINANFIAQEKEFLVLVGPSGCGKTTTLRMIAGLESISQGNIYIDERKVNDVPPKDRDIAMVFQNYALYPHMSVYENMAFALKLRKASKSEIDEKVKKATNMLGIENLLDRKPKQLSGGQRQRVALGRAIVRNPKVFLFDEPLSNLDAKMRVQMRTEISKLHNTLQATMIYVTHDQVEAMTMGSKIVVMKDGIINQIDSPLKIYNYPVNMFVAGFIGSPAMNFIKGELVAENKKLYLVFIDKGNESQKIPLPDDLNIKLNNYPHKEIIFGIRPEDIYDSRYSSMAEYAIELDAICELVEPLGNEYIVYLKLNDSTITARFDPKILPEINKPLRITFDMSKGHFFDVETKNSIYI
ncbi:MAG: sn-glycerol-3-phosphate ABC transporter ATP-binding protein UgpC [Candidatus Cloacimonetes bacterium]|nr:sn-glycerol-3-phosphate ABC transporter ATP-binding protein UgpC [Candidatus Cloacimonadota bacterium]